MDTHVRQDVRVSRLFVMSSSKPTILVRPKPSRPPAFGRIILTTVVSLAIAMAVSWPNPTRAAGLRGELRTSMTLVESRGLVRERIDESEVPGEGTWRRLEDGTVVICIPGEGCYHYVPGDVETATPLSQELRLTGWSNVRGLSGRMHLRSRYGSDSFWPRSAERFELVTGYAELDRGVFRLRGGRLSRLTGLGFHEWDGGAALWRPSRRFEVEVFGGRGLARGVSQPVNGFLIEDIDEYAPDRAGVLLGGEMFARYSRAFFGSVAYQRTIRTDRGALYSEQMAAELHGALAPVRFDLSSDYDVTTGNWNDARAHFAASIGQPWQGTLDLRYRRPRFDLWTIWEAFSPIGYREARLGGTWTESSRRLDLSAGAAYRSYEETENEISFLPIRDDSWQVDTRAVLRQQPWRWEAAYRMDLGYGAAGTQVDLAANRTFSDRFHAGAQTFVAQQTREFRNGQDWIWGGGVNAVCDVASLTVRGSLGLYRLSYDNRPDYPDWNQKRAHLSATYSFGADPGASRPVSTAAKDAAKEEAR